MLNQQIKNAFENISFRWKAIIFIALIEGIFNIIFAIIVVGVMQDNLEGQFLKRAKITADLFATTAVTSVLTTDLAALESIVDEVMANEDLLYSRIRNTTDILSERARNQGYLERKFRDDQSLSTVNDGVFDTHSLIVIGGEEYGRVEIGLSTNYLAKTISFVQIKVILIGVGEILISALFSFILGSFLVRKLTDLREAAQLVAEGGIGIQIATRGNDELAQTANSFNHMSRNLASVLEDLRTSNQELESAHKLAQAVLDTAMNGIITIDERGVIQEFNTYSEQIFGYKAQEVIGKRFSILLLEDIAVDGDPFIQKLISWDENTILGPGQETHGQDINGESFPILLHLNKLGSEHGICFVCSVTDLTDIRKREQALNEARELAEEASFAKSTFLATMSHEIRTPLNGILGSLGLLADTLQTEEQKKFTNVGNKAASSLLNVINDILDFSKIEAGKLDFEISPFQLHTELRAVFDVLRSNADDKKLTLNSNIDIRTPELLEGDAGRLRQVLLNLVGNAVKFTDVGSVTVNVSVPDRNEAEATLLFEVLDTGIGIKEDDKTKLFSEFNTLVPNYTQNRNGTGLGLIITRNLVELMGGKIGFESAFGKGSRFWFSVTLPLVSDAKAIHHQKTTELVEPRNVEFCGRVLLAEDNTANQMVAKAMLEKMGVAVDLAANGIEAVNAANQRNYDLILMDIGMPEMDGIEATKIIRDGYSGEKHTPIIAMTAHVMKGDREKLISSGMDDYLAKPASKMQIASILDKWLKPKSIEFEAKEIFSSDANNAHGSSEIDIAVLKKLGDDTSPELLPELIATFVSHATERLNTIQSATDMSKVEEEAHALKSSAATFGAPELNRLASELEIAGRSENLELVLRLKDEIAVHGKVALAQLTIYQTDIFQQKH